MKTTKIFIGLALITILIFTVACNSKNINDIKLNEEKLKDATEDINAVDTIKDAESEIDEFIINEDDDVELGELI
jgi:hypothetical protein